MKRMNILQVVEASNAGVGRHVRGLCEGLFATGHRITVAYAPYRVDAAFQHFIVEWRDKIDFVPLNLRREVSPKSDLASFYQLLRLVKREGAFDVIHGHSSKGGAIARLVGCLSGVKTVYTPHSLIMSSPEIPGVKSAVYTLVERVLGNLATSKMIAVSKEEREMMIKLKLIPSKRIALINNGLDDGAFKAFSRLETARGSSHDKPLTFGSSMRFSAQKAPENLVEAFVQLVGMLPQIPMRLVIAGDGELFAEVRARAQASGLGERISLLGYSTEVDKVLRECDVFVLSSLYEGFSYAILEAMAASLPIVSTDVFGAEETIAQVPGNVVVPAGDPGALARGMKQMVAPISRGSSREALKEIGQANYDYARSRFTQSETTRQVLEIYQELC
jgi:glycosyltransferase involved in cell wall biosynthesis